MHMAGPVTGASLTWCLSLHSPLTPRLGVAHYLLGSTLTPPIYRHLQIMPSTTSRSSSAVAFTVLGLFQGAASFGLDATLTYDFRGEHFSLDPKPQWSTADLTVVNVAASGSGVCETQGFDRVRFV